MYQEGFHTYHVYIITNKNRTVLYTGMTNYLARRLSEHDISVKKQTKGFSSRYRCGHLLYYEKFTWVHEALAREKEIKGWSREKKLELIKSINPELNFLEYLFPFQMDS
ncbi:GIY-YIG nuclease family protein [Flavobacteriaceae bacterium 3-367]|uniref:GIY-YIG nuclease family protein n=1 Tax=Eudoraea algarum TaxID=3417568 RepID=UPI003276DD98